MKNGKIWAIVLIVLLAVVLILVGVSRPKAFNWNPTHTHRSEHPFGCSLLDEVLSRSVDAGYTTVRGHLSDVAGDSTLGDHNVMLVADNYILYESEVNAIDSLLEQGRSVLMVVNDLYIPYDFYNESNDDDSDFAVDPDEEVANDDDSEIAVDPDEEVANDDDYYGDYQGGYDRIDYVSGMNDDEIEFNALRLNIERLQVFDKETLGKDIKNHEMARINWPARPPFDSMRYSAPTSLVGGVIEPDTAQWQVLATVDVKFTWLQNPESYEGNEFPVVAVMERGDARFVVATTAYMFSNYGILDEEISPFVMRLVSLLGTERPIVRADNYKLPPPMSEPSENKIIEEDDSAPGFLNYFLEHKALRWATYTVLALIVLAMIFSARRRQRIIPPQTPPHNMALDMVKHYGKLFYSRHDNKDLLFKKYCLFGLDLFRKLLVDIDNPATKSEAFATLAQVTGRDLEQLTDDLDELRRVACGEDDLSNQEVKKYIDLMNLILDEAGIRKQTPKTTKDE